MSPKLELQTTTGSPSGSATIRARHRMRLPIATLTKYKLEAGAFFDLKTKTLLSHGLVPQPAIGLDLQPIWNPELPTVVSLAIMPPEPTVARVTCANGFEYSEDLNKRLWPAKGS